MSRRRKQVPPRPTDGAPTPLSDEPMDALTDERGGAGAEGSFDSEDTAPESGDRDAAGEGDAPLDEALAADGAPVGPSLDADAPEPSEGAGPAVSGSNGAALADVVARLGDSEGLVVPAPRDAQPPIATFVDDRPEAAVAQRPTPRRGHVYARVCGPGTPMVPGYTLDGEQRSRWQAGEEGQFRRGDVESLPEHFEELQ